jgi:hypothetical protein
MEAEYDANNRVTGIDRHAIDDGVPDTVHPPVAAMSGIPVGSITADGASVQPAATTGPACGETAEMADMSG